MYIQIQAKEYFSIVDVPSRNSQLTPESSNRTLIAIAVEIQIRDRVMRDSIEVAVVAAEFQR